MAITADQIAQLAVLFGVIATAWASWRQAQRAARKDELEELRCEVNRLQARLEKAEKDLDRATLYTVRLLEYIGELQRLMREAGLNPPPIPDVGAGQKKTKKVDE